MIPFIALILALGIWIQGQLTYGLRGRMLSSVALLVALGFTAQAAYKINDFYRRGILAGAMKNMTAKLPEPEKAEYQALIEKYKRDRDVGASDLRAETERLKSKYQTPVAP